MLATNIGIDLGTYSVSIYMEGKGVVLSEPSVIAYNKNNKIIGIGKKAYDMFEKNPEGVKVVRPLNNGIICDFTAAKHMMEYYISKVCKNMVLRPNVIISVPSTLTELEKKSVLDLATASGASKSCLIESPLAAALGAGLDNEKPKGIMIVDIGAGSTDIAVITMGCIAVSKSIKTAGISFDEAIMRQIRRERDIVIGEKTAEKIKTTIGSAVLRDVELGMTVKGKSYITKMPVSFEVSSTEVFLALRPQFELIIEGIRSTLESTSPELAADILDSGIVLSGGGSLLRKIDKMFEKRTGIKTRVATDAEYCVANGTGRAITHMNILLQNGYVFKDRSENDNIEKNDNL